MLNKINPLPRKGVNVHLHPTFPLIFQNKIVLLDLAPPHCCRLPGVIGPVPRPLWIRDIHFLAVRLLSRSCNRSLPGMVGTSMPTISPSSLKCGNYRAFILFFNELFNFWRSQRFRQLLDLRSVFITFAYGQDVGIW